MDSTPGLEVYESYETDYKQLAASIGGKLKGEAKDATGEQRKAVLRRVEMELEEADEIIEQMDVEVQSVPREHKTKLQVKLRAYKGEMARYKAEVVRRTYLYIHTSIHPDMLPRSPRNPSSPAQTAMSYCLAGQAGATAMTQISKLVRKACPKLNGNACYGAPRPCPTRRGDSKTRTA